MKKTRNCCYVWIGVHICIVVQIVGVRVGCQYCMLKYGRFYALWNSVCNMLNIRYSLWFFILFANSTTAEQRKCNVIEWTNLPPKVFNLLKVYTHKTGCNLWFRISLIIIKRVGFKFVSFYHASVFSDQRSSNEISYIGWSMNTIYMHKFLICHFNSIKWKSYSRKYSQR